MRRGGLTIRSSGTSNAVPVFGNGADGVAAFDGATACAGSTRVGSTYTLDRDVFYTVAVVSLGVTVKTNGFRLFASASIVNLGIISRDGVAGVTLTAGAALVAGTLGASFAGGNGRGAVGAGVAGTNGSQNAATGGDGGNGAAAAGVVAAGGGGGGGGGVVIVVTRAIPIGGGYAGVQVNGGDGGLKTITGFDGDSGNAGTVIPVLF